MGAAMSQVIDATSFDDIHYIVDGSTIGEKLKLRGSLSPATMSDLYRDMGADDVIVRCDGLGREGIRRVQERY